MHVKRHRTGIVLAALSGLAGGGCMASEQQLADQISQFGVSYQVTDNHAAQHGVDCAALGADWAACNRALIRLTNPGPALSSQNWAIYLSSIRPILKVESDQFRISHIIGDLHKLQPTEKFTGFAAGETVSIPIINEYWQLAVSDVMPRWYVSAGDAAIRVIASTDSEDLTRFVAPFGAQWQRTAEDKNVLMNAQTRFEKNRDIKTLAAASLRGQITPTPLQLTVGAEDVDLQAGVALDLLSLSADKAAVIRQHFARAGVEPRADGYPVATAIDRAGFRGALARSGAYRLVIARSGARVTGYDPAGVFYGLMSILSLLPADGDKKIAALEASDAPRFAYRGVALDVARNFHSKAAVKRLLDQMAAWKMNKLHFHLTDDEGWRIEIAGLPELTAVAGRRCHDPSEQRCLLPQLGSGPDSDNSGSGYFSRADYIDILQYAAARLIEVIPEVDMPAHARAAVIAMEARYQRLMRQGKAAEAAEYRLLDADDSSNTTSVQFYDRTSYLNPCLDSSKRFVAKVIGEFRAMHQAAGQPLTRWHFGGDEAQNIRLGPGYTDRRHPEAGKGIINRQQEDHPWARSPVCQRMVQQGRVASIADLPGWFAIEVSRLAQAQGIHHMQAWQDGLKTVAHASAFATPQVTVNFWDTLYWGGFDSVNDWAKKGYEVVVSSPDYLYMDFPYEVNPLEPGYYWGTRFNDERKMFSFAPDNLAQNAETSVDRDGNRFSAKSAKPWPGAQGISAQLWSETVRSDRQMEAMIFPRLLSVAERGWHRAGWELDYQPGREYQQGKTHWVDTAALRQDWQRFANLLGQRELAKLDKQGIAWRLPLPGGRIYHRVLEANSALPGIRIEFSTDGGKQWQRYDPQLPPRVGSEVWLRSASADGGRYSRVEKLQAPQAMD
ncbi:beta-N-acetylhexosaminidase [Pantoea sp. B65]|uniref:beta-N-acetylhexosaminidase n=1 Tax=Pantoea sp. B65 TaxID=2813359 RepID=UPI0039B4EE53